MSWRLRVALAAGALALGLLPALGDRFWLQLAGKTMITGIFAMSLDLLVGYVGLVSLGHATFFGLAAFLLAGLSNHFGLVSPVTTLPLCLAAAAVAALAIGWLSLRATGVYFVMVTLAFAQMLFYLFSEAPGLGGSDGVYVSARPIEDWNACYLAIWICLLFVFFLLRWTTQTRFGRVLSGIRINEARMRTLGYPTRRYQLAAFALAGTLAGLAGYLDATLYGFVNPALFGWRQSGLVLVTVLLGGKGTLYGPVLGALFLSLLEHFGERATQHWNALIGGVVVLTVLFLPQGIAGLLRGRRV